MSPEFRDYVSHPRYGQGPRITGLNPANDFATGRVFLHWHSPEAVRIPGTAIPADLSRQMPATVPVTHYFDARRKCVDCGRPFIFFAAEQKYWYEELGFPLESDCVRCVECRKKQQGLELKRQRYEELFHEQPRSPEKTIEMAECALSLAEAGVFGKRIPERVRAILRNIPADPTVQALLERAHVLEQGGG